MDAKALGQLIELCGGDEFIIQLKRGVMENALRLRVSTLHNSALDNAFKDEVIKKVAEQVGETAWKQYQGRVVELNPEFKALIKADVAAEVAAARNTLQLELYKEITTQVSAWASGEFASTLEGVIDKKITAAVNDEIDRRVNERLRTMIRAAGL